MQLLLGMLGGGLMLGGTCAFRRSLYWGGPSVAVSPLMVEALPVRGPPAISGSIGAIAGMVGTDALKARTARDLVWRHAT